ncbi:MAG: hypothetical protein AAGJ93_10930, partial [Bacteroidota bacterium]
MWVCSNDATHQFPERTEDGFCPHCSFRGTLIPEAIDKLDDQPQGTVPKGEQGEQRDVGLCILLMDASGSMSEKPFSNAESTKAELIARSAARGIFDLESMTMTQNAYLCIIMFDANVKQIAFDTVSNLLRKHHRDPIRFEQFLLSKLKEMGGMTDLNKALLAAEALANKFLNKSIPSFQDYTVMKHRIMKKDAKTISVPNVRVLLYTDGHHNATGEVVVNPFQGQSPDLLMGAYFGAASDKGNQQLT